MKLSTLIEDLIEAKSYLKDKEKENATAREEYLDNGGASWGYYGQSYYDKIADARSEVESIKEKIDICQNL